MRPAWTILAAALFAGACAADDPFAVPLESVVGVRAIGCSLIDETGTGVVIDHRGDGAGEQNLIVTTAHTVAGARAITIEFADGEVTDGEIVALDPERDLAVLEPASPISGGRGLASAEVKQRVTIVTWLPADGFVSQSSSIARRLRVTIEDIYVEDLVERRGLELTADIVPGHSGAPVFDRSGAVLGVVYARSRERGGTAFAVASEEIRALLDDLPVSERDGGRCP
jgi:S1-C subfamily serine protease